MVLKTLLILINVEITASCNIHNDLLVMLKMLQRLIEWGKSWVNQRRKCVFFSQLFFDSYLLKCGTLFINNNFTSNIRISSRIKQMTSRQMSNNNMMTRRGTLLMTILITNLTQNYYWQSPLIYYNLFFFYICFQFKLIIYITLCFRFINFTILLLISMYYFKFLR